MDLDSLITTVLVIVILITPVVTAFMFFSNRKLKKNMAELSLKLDEMSAHQDAMNRENAAKISDELAKQRRMLTESLAAVNENVTRGVVNMSKQNRQ